MFGLDKTAWSRNELNNGYYMYILPSTIPATGTRVLYLPQVLRYYKVLYLPGVLGYYTCLGY